MKIETASQTQGNPAQTETTPTRPQGRQLIQIKKSTLVRTAKYAGVGAGVFFMGYIAMNSNAAEIIKSYIDPFLEKIGIEQSFENPVDTIEAKIDDTCNDVEEIFVTNKNRMGQGVYNNLMPVMDKRVYDLETIFFQYAKGTEIARYAKEALNPERMTARLEAYGKNAPRGEVVQTIVENEKAMEGYLITVLPKEEQEAHYLDMALLPVSKGWLTDTGYGKVIDASAQRASPETVATVASQYLTTPESRKLVMEGTVGQMTSEERLETIVSLASGLPPKEYDAAVVALTPRLSTDGYTQVEKQVSDKKWDQRFDKGKELLDKANEYVKNR